MSAWPTCVEARKNVPLTLIHRCTFSYRVKKREEEKGKRERKREERDKESKREMERETFTAVGVTINLQGEKDHTWGYQAVACGSSTLLGVIYAGVNSAT